jgi:hypothetical protein
VHEGDAQCKEELEVIRRQVDDVKQVLSEQRRFAHRGAIVEETTVEELIRQAAEVIPEDLRAVVRLDIDLAGAYRALRCIRSFRTLC